MKIHAREENVRRAERAVRDALNAAIKAEGLTTAEVLRVVATVFGDEVGLIAKICIRAERHPEDPDTPGGVE